ncbi:MAG: UDP-N-acetylmuramoyl-L-alanine--D-glutamate ligase [Acidimicrobiales bacterium]
MKSLVVGFAVTGQATARALRSRGDEVVVVDDGEPIKESDKIAASLGAELVWHPSKARLADLASRADLVVLSPGVPPSHPVFSVSDSDKVVSEIELAATLSRVPFVAVTGTNGKTTVTSLVAEILSSDGKRVEAVGNIGRAFIEAVGTAEAEMFVVEVSSFQLAWTKSFRPLVSCWLNFAEDHLDWHLDLEHYAAAKARIWANQANGDIAVVNAADPVVMEWSAKASGRLVTFGVGGDVTERDGRLVAPEGEICSVWELPRSLPHDIANACAAAAASLAAGADLRACRAGLLRGVPMRHRIELVGESERVRWFDDSKATTPSAVLAALTGFESVVLIAGGRNKSLNLGAILDGLESEAETRRGPGPKRLRAVVTIGEAAAEMAAVFERADGIDVRRAASMTEAVELARALALPGDSVLLSPGCASFDWYRSYGERGDDFARAVRTVLSQGLEHTRQGGAQ